MYFNFTGEAKKKKWLRCTCDKSFERISPSMLVIFEDGIVIFSPNTRDHYLDDLLHKTLFISKFQVVTKRGRRMTKIV